MHITTRKSPVLKGHAVIDIVTKYIRPYLCRGARITAKCEILRVTLPWDYAMNPQENHEAAAAELLKCIDDRNATKYGPGVSRMGALPRVCGQTKSGEYVHVFARTP